MVSLASLIALSDAVIVCSAWAWLVKASDMATTRVLSFIMFWLFG
jgi:hypothetical protein